MRCILCMVGQQHDASAEYADHFHTKVQGKPVCRPEPGQRALVPQADEIEAAAWMPLEEYAALPFIHGRPLLLRTLECCLA